MQNFTLHIFKLQACRTYYHMVEHTARTPSTWVLSGEAAPSREWLNIGWDEGEKLFYQTGFICPYAPLQYKNMAIQLH